MDSLRLHIYYDDFYKEVDLSTCLQGRLIIGSDESNDVVLHSVNVERCSMILSKELNEWYIEDPIKTGVVFNGRNIDKHRMEAGDFYTVSPSKKGADKIYVAVMDASSYDESFIAFDLKTQDMISIGGKEENHICFKRQIFSNTEICQLEKKQHGYTLTKVKSSKYKKERCREIVFVNQRRVYADYDLKNQDRLSIDGITLIYHHKQLSKLLDGYEVVAEETYLEVANTSIDVRVQKLEEMIFEKKKADQETFFEIQGRLTSQFEEGEIILKQPKRKMEKPEINWVSVFIPPAIMAFAYVVIMPIINANYRNGTMFAVFSMFAVLTSIINYISQIYKYKKKSFQRVKDYERYLDSMKVTLNHSYEQEKELLFLNHSDFSSCLITVKERRRNLWERSHVHDDFLTLKIGNGDCKIRTKIVLPEIDALESQPDPLVEKAIALGSQYASLENVPLTVDLKKEKVMSLRGEKIQVDYILHSMITEIVTKHSYEEVKLVFIMSESQKEKWQWVRWLPHVWDSARQQRYIATTKEDAKNMLTSIQEIIKERLCGEDTGKMKTMMVPHFVFIIFDRDIIQNNPMVPILVNPEEAAAVSSVFALDNTEWVPQHCQAEIKTDHLKGQLIRNGIRNQVSIFETEAISPEQMENLSKCMAPIRTKNIGGNVEVPSRVSLFEALDIVDIKDLDITEKWKVNKSYESLRTPIGKKSGGELFYFDIHEKEHGPHGLVAGTTGSGKSETLLAYLVSLATNYHPHYVSYIIIDYKGGGMINELEGLPHLLGAITNLDDNEINRSLLSLRSELKRRQRIFDTYKINHIDAYQKLYKDGLASIAMPHLLLIVDEFAELKADQPEFMKELISAARIGRSLGLHLILATQKPSGVVNDQIWSNSKFKLCLKVSTPEDSREVLKRADASYITLPGRAYLQVGNDEMFELFQSAYGGIEYSEKEDGEDQSVYKVDLMGRKSKIYPLELDFMNKKTKMTQMKKLVQRIGQEALDNKITALESPWKPSLASRYSLTDYYEHLSVESQDQVVKGPSKADYEIPLGIYDNPAEQEQGDYSLALAKTGSIMIYGNATMGKTTLIETFAMSIIQTYGPEEIQVYMMDFGSRILSVFEASKQVGGVILAEETDRIMRLLNHLKETLKERKERFTEVGVTNIHAFNEYSKEKLPLEVVLIDNIGYLREFDELDYNAILTWIIREGMNYGIFFIVTANNIQAVTSKMRNVIPTVISLHLNEKADYRNVISAPIDIEPGTIQGRAIAPYNGKYVEVQFYQPESGEKEFEITQNIKDKIEILNEGISDEKIFIIKKMQKEISLAKMWSLDRKDYKIGRLPLGLDMEELEFRNLYLEEFGGFLINGKRKSGITNTISLLLAELDRLREGEVEHMDTEQTDTEPSPSRKVYFFDNFFKDLKFFETRVDHYVDVKQMNPKTLESLSRDIQDQEIRTVIIIHDYTYFEKGATDALKSKIQEAVTTGLYNKCNVFVGVTETGITGFDTLSSAVKKIDSGLILGNCDYGLNQLGIRVSFEAKKEAMEPGRGYLKTDRYNDKIQVFMQDLLQEEVLDDASIG